jgi:hypothetical protein
MISFRSIALALFFIFALSLAAQADHTWKGWISDSRCGANGAHPGDADCARSCVKRGAKYVFVDDADKKVYLLDPQDKVESHAGEHVTVKGTVVGHALKFTSMEPLP